MPITINGSGTIGGLSVGGLEDATVTPSDLSTGSPSWDSSGNLSFNSGYGSVARAFGCRAWVNFNGSGTVSIRASGNVSSITDNGTGDYTINFSTSLTDANYSFSGAVYWNSGAPSGLVGSGLTAPTSSAFKVITLSNNTDSPTDFPYVFVSVHR